MRAKTFLLTMLLALAVPAGAQNKFGVMTHLTAPSYDLDAANRYMEAAARMAGEWGWVRQYVTADPNEVDSDITYLLLARAHRLRPVLYINDLAEEWLVRAPDGSHRPRHDDDGGYTGAAASVAEWLRRVHAAGGRVPWLELWNEPNLSEGWGAAPNPREYARYHMAVAAAVRAVDPDIILLNAAMAISSGTDDDGDGQQGQTGDRNLDSFYFIRTMFDERPDMASAIDLWSSHPYPLNQPPTWDKSPYTAGGYRWELRELAQFGFAPKVLITETGYRLGDHANGDFPPITEETRTAWLLEAYRDVWLPDDNLVGICPFLLGDPLWREMRKWEGFEYIDDRMKPLPILEAVAALPRMPGSDYLPGGDGIVRGVVTDESGRAVPRALVYTTPGGRGAVTDADGAYTITGLPEGVYTLAVRASAHADASTPLTVGEEPQHVAFSLERIGLLPRGDFESGIRRHREDTPAPVAAPGLGIGASTAARLAPGAALFDDTDYLSAEAGVTYVATVRYRPAMESATPTAARIAMDLTAMRSHDPNPNDGTIGTTTETIDTGWRELRVKMTPRHHLTQRLRVVVSALDMEILVDDLRVDRLPSPESEQAPAP